MLQTTLNDDRNYDIKTHNDNYMQTQVGHVKLIVAWSYKEFSSKTCHVCFTMQLINSCQ